MKNVEVGQKVVAFWGAMHPQEDCVVTEVNEFYSIIVNEEGEEHSVSNFKEMPINGVGIYIDNEVA